jgi:hypothetical protein
MPSLRLATDTAVTCSTPSLRQQIRDGGTDGSAVADQQDLHQSLATVNPTSDQS